MKDRIRVIITVLLCIAALCLSIMAVLNVKEKLFDSDVVPVADYENRILIWNDVAGNTDDSKLDDMNYDAAAIYRIAINEFDNTIIGEEFRDSERTIDTITYVYEIRDGYVSESYDDEPYIIPYIVPDSIGSVIIVPGGGYVLLSTEKETKEGRDVALALNEAGYSAFVLYYRTNPYEYPIPQLDVQRAVRYIRYHSEELGISSDNIALLGFSAGGFQVGSYINCVMNQDMFPADYVPDETDSVDDSVDAAGLIYPVMTFRYNVPMLFALFDDELVRDENSREELLHLTDLSEHIISSSVRQLLVYGTDDGLVDIRGTRNYIECALEAGVLVNDVVIQGYGHGFTLECYLPYYLDMLNDAWQS